jgi:hypothetical protein
MLRLASYSDHARFLPNYFQCTARHYSPATGGAAINPQRMPFFLYETSGFQRGEISSCGPLGYDTVLFSEIYVSKFYET